MELTFQEELPIDVRKVQQLTVRGNFAAVLSEGRSVLVIDLVLRI